MSSASNPESRKTLWTVGLEVALIIPSPLSFTWLLDWVEFKAFSQLEGGVLPDPGCTAPSLETGPWGGKTLADFVYPSEGRWTLPEGQSQSQNYKQTTKTWKRLESQDKGQALGTPPPKAKVRQASSLPSAQFPLTTQGSDAWRFLIPVSTPQLYHPFSCIIPIFPL